MCMCVCICPGPPVEIVCLCMLPVPVSTCVCICMRPGLPVALHQCNGLDRGTLHRRSWFGCPRPPRYIVLCADFSCACYRSGCRLLSVVCAVVCPMDSCVAVSLSGLLSVVCWLLSAVWSVCVNVLARTRRPNEQAPSPTKVMSARKRAESMMCWFGADGPNAHKGKSKQDNKKQTNYIFNKSLRVNCLPSTV